MTNLEQKNKNVYEYKSHKCAKILEDKYYKKKKEKKRKQEYRQEKGEFYKRKKDRKKAFSYSGVMSSATSFQSGEVKNEVLNSST